MCYLGSMKSYSFIKLISVQAIIYIKLKEIKNNGTNKVFYRLSKRKCFVFIHKMHNIHIIGQKVRVVLGFSKKTVIWGSKIKFFYLYCVL